MSETIVTGLVVGDSGYDTRTAYYLCMYRQRHAGTPCLVNGGHCPVKFRAHFKIRGPHVTNNRGVGSLYILRQPANWPHRRIARLMISSGSPLNVFGNFGLVECLFGRGSYVRIFP